MLFAVGEEDDAAKFHVDTRGEQSRCNEDEDRLDGIGRNAKVGGFLTRFGALKELCQSTNKALSVTNQLTAMKPMTSNSPPMTKGIKKYVLVRII